jgi:hypothetical protein
MLGAIILGYVVGRGLRQFYSGAYRGTFAAVGGVLASIAYALIVFGPHSEKFDPDRLVLSIGQFSLLGLLGGLMGERSAFSKRRDAWTEAGRATKQQAVGYHSNFKVPFAAFPVIAFAAVALALISSLSIWYPQDRYVSKDGSLLCPKEHHLQEVLDASSSSWRAELTKTQVEEAGCRLLLKGDRLRIGELSSTGQFGLVMVERDRSIGWMSLSDFHPLRSVTVVKPWFSESPTLHARAKPGTVDFTHRATTKPDDTASSQPILTDDGRCADWSHALTHEYMDECRQREASPAHVIDTSNTQKPVEATQQSDREAAEEYERLKRKADQRKGPQGPPPAVFQNNVR